MSPAIELGRAVPEVEPPGGDCLVAGDAVLREPRRHGLETGHFVTAIALVVSLAAVIASTSKTELNANAPSIPSLLACMNSRR